MKQHLKTIHGAQFCSCKYKIIIVLHLFIIFALSCLLGLTTTILQQLDQLDVQKELDKLERGQAIGDERHKQQLIDFITDQRQLLAECLFCFACQSPLPRSDCLQLLSFLKKCPSTEADGTLDSVTLTLLMTMLYCLNVDPLDEAAEMQSSFRGEEYYIILVLFFVLYLPGAGLSKVAGCR